MKIQSLEIENFKVFGDKFNEVSNVADMSLILLNGPNGYGKTTLFDAIELALTGEIKRIGTYTKDLAISKTETHEKFILISNEQKEAYVKLTLELGSDRIELNRVYRPGRSKKQKASKVKNPNTIFNQFQLEVKINDEIIEADRNDEVLKQYHLYEIKDFYDKCCFLSQDEHLGFLKEASKNKASALEFLFEVPAEQRAEEARVKRLMERFKNGNTIHNLGIIRRLTKQEETLRKEMEVLEEKIKDYAHNAVHSDYKRIFSRQTISWDQEIKEINSETYDEAMEEIEKLIYFSTHQAECLNYLSNHPYRKILKAFVGNDSITYKKNTLEYAYRYYPLIKQEEQMERAFLFRQMRRWKR